MSPDSLVLWFGGLAVLAGSACGAAQNTSSKVELSAAVGAVPADLEDEYQLFAVNCSKCHGLERPLTAPVTDHGHWERYVAKMMRTPGSGISAREAPGILAFLFWYTDRRTGNGGLDKSADGVEAPAPGLPGASPPEPIAPVLEAPSTTLAPAPQGENTP